MSLKIKLILFIVVLVFIASIAILAISVYQTRKRGKEDVLRIKTNETVRVKNAYKEHVDIMYSLISAQYQRSFSRDEVATIFNEVRNVTYDNGRGYFWISDLQDTPQVLIYPYLDSIHTGKRLKAGEFVQDIDRQVRNHGDGFVETMAPALRGKIFVRFINTRVMLCAHICSPAMGYCIRPFHGRYSRCYQQEIRSNET